MPSSGHLGAELRDEHLNGEVFYTLKEAKVLIEQWRRHYNTLHAAQRAGLQTTGTGGDLARHQCAGLRCAPATTGGLATTPDSLIKGGPLRSGWSLARTIGLCYLSRQPAEVIWEMSVQWALPQSFDPVGYPTEPLDSHQTNRQLFGWILPPLVICAVPAH